MSTKQMKALSLGCGHSETWIVAEIHGGDLDLTEGAAPAVIPAEFRQWLRAQRDHLDDLESILRHLATASATGGAS